jgi:hypothetical protein
MGLPSQAQAIAPYLQAASSTYGVPVEILGAIAKQETSFGANPNTYTPGSAGELGVMQTTPAIVSQYGINPYDPQSDINGAAAYLATLYTQKGNWPAAVAAYNGTGQAAQNYSSQVMGTAQSYGYAGATGATGSSAADWTQFLQNVAKGFGLDPVGTSSSNVSMGNAPGQAAAAGIGAVSWLSNPQNLLVLTALAGAGILAIVAIASAFTGGGGGGSKTTIMPVPV